VDLVLNLHQAARENRKAELKSKVMGFSVAVMHALDAAFGGGKGKILEKWVKAIDGPGEAGEGSSLRGSSLSPGARAFFSGAPVVTKKD
jgi:hypothetical protein